MATDTQRWISWRLKRKQHYSWCKSRKLTVNTDM